MKALRDSGFPAILAVLVLSAHAWAVTSKKPVKPVAKPAAAAADTQLDASDLIAQAHDAQNRGDAALAERLAQAAIVAGPARPDTYDALGDVYAADNQPDFARSYYNEALSIDPADASATKALAALDHGTSQQAAKADAQGAKTGTP